MLWAFHLKMNLTYIASFLKISIKIVFSSGIPKLVGTFPSKNIIFLLLSWNSNAVDDFKYSWISLEYLLLSSKFFEISSNNGYTLFKYNVFFIFSSSLVKYVYSIGNDKHSLKNFIINLLTQGFLLHSLSRTLLHSTCLHRSSHTI